MGQVIGVRQTLSGRYGLNLDGRSWQSQTSYATREEADAAAATWAARLGAEIGDGLATPDDAARQRHAAEMAADAERRAEMQAKAEAAERARASRERRNAAARQRDAAEAQDMTVEGLTGRTAVDRESGSLMIYQRYRVQRPGHESHIVEVEVSGDSGTPQHEHCDCRGFQYRHECAHVAAVYNAGVLGCEW